jgi:hypothetical protein
LPDVEPNQFRMIRGEQEIIARYEPEQALLTLPKLLADPADRRRMLTLIDKLMADPRVQAAKPSANQQAMLVRIREVLEPGAGPDAAAKPERRKLHPAAMRATGERRAQTVAGR